VVLRPFVLTGTFLIEYALLWLGWVCYRRAFTKKQVARGMVFAFIGVCLFLHFVGGAVYLPGHSCLLDGSFQPADPIRFRPPGDLLNLSPAG